MGNNVRDPKLKDWVLPDFTTTTPEDRTVAAVLFMGAMQKYFEYFFSCITCGIPEITLLGEREDWVKLQNRLGQLLHWGGQAKLYQGFLAPIFKNIVASFDDPTSESITSFWKEMVSHHGPDPMSGANPNPFVTGWITGLFLWKPDGKICIETLEDGAVLDGVIYPRLHLEDDLVPAVASVPVTLQEINDGMVVRSIETRMMAGICGFQPCDAQKTPPVAEANGQGNGSKQRSRIMGSKFLRRLSARFKNGESEETRPSEGADQGEGSGNGTANPKGGSPGDEPTQNTVKPVAFWWIYKVADESRE